MIKQNYLVPLLFPDIKPRNIKIENQCFEEIEKNFEWECDYKLCFHPSSVWKILFLKLRKNCVESEEFYEMEDEFYWIDGVIFSFKNKKTEQKVIVKLEIFSDQSTNNLKKSASNNTLTLSDQKTHFETNSKFTMKITIKSDENPQKIFDEIHYSVKEFISKWISSSKSNLIEFSLSRKSFEKEEKLKLMDQDKKEEKEKEKQQLNDSIKHSKEIIESKKENKKEIVICAFCGSSISLIDNKRECENCMSKHFLVENQFAIIQVMDEGLILFFY